MRHVAAVGLAIAAVLVVLGCTLPASGPSRVPSEEEALAFLDRIVATVRTRDRDAICALGVGGCRRQLERLGLASIPDLPPTVLSVRRLEPRSLGDGSWAEGGQVLELSGIDGLGRPYHGEILVLVHQGELSAIYPTFWWNRRIGDLGTPVGIDLESPP